MNELLLNIFRMAERYHFDHLIGMASRKPITCKHILSKGFIWFVVATLAACGGGGGGGASSNTNSNGAGAGTVITIPGAPVIGSATAGNAQATVTFTAPASNGGAAITSYTVTSSSGGLTANGSGSPLTVTGLTNGVTYTFTVTATNSAGTGPASAPSNSVTPIGAPVVTVPGAPIIGAATAGNAQATVTFTAPVSNGGAVITGYTVTSSTGGFIAIGTASPLTVTGLTNGQAYTFTVTATNSVGTSTASAPSNSVTPVTVPGTPVIGTATASNAQATVTFTAPGSNGGAAITGYTVTSSSGSFTASGPASPLTVTGLTNGVAYTFTVTATNAAGTGSVSAASNSVTPIGPPGAPVIGTATGGNAQATVTFTPPVSNGGATITSYTVTSSPGGFTASGSASPLTVTGLTNGQAYTFTVTATNTAGTGSASVPSNSVTPITVPGAPVIGTATTGNAQATVTFTAPVSNGGATITSYTATSNSGEFVSGSASPLTVTGLTNGVAYTFTVTATNAAGTSAASVASNSVTPIGPPVVSVSATSPKVLTFSWTGITGATHYQLLKNPNGVSGYTQVGADILDPTTSATDYIGVHLHDWINARYIVQACNAGGCVSSSDVFTTPAMISAIGYFKASNTGDNDFFGHAVSLSADGNTMAVGAPNEDSSTTGINSTPDEGATDAGAVYVYSRSGNIWSQQAYVKAFNTGGGDDFGTSVSLSADGNILAVGAYNEDSSTTGINSTPDDTAGGAGAVYVFSRSGTTWSQQAYVKSSNNEAGDQFGLSVSLSADGATMAVGALTEDSSTTGINSTPDNGTTDAGAAYVFSRSGSTWSEQAYVKASNTGSSDQFGWDVSLSADGDTLAVAANQEDSSTTGINSTPNEGASNSGAVYVFVRSGSTWSHQAYVKASNSGGSDQFGYNMSLSEDGTTLAVGTFLENAVYVFTRSGSTWSQQAYVQESNPGGDRFGQSVSLSANGDILAVASQLEDSSTTGINSTPNEGASNSGAVYVFVRSGTTWSQQAYVKSPHTEAFDQIGRSVSLSADGATLAVGAVGEDSSTTGINSTPNNAFFESGAVYLY